MYNSSVDEYMSGIMLMQKSGIFFLAKYFPKKCIFEFVIHPWDAKIETKTLIEYNVDPVLLDPFKTSGDSKPTRWSPRTLSKNM